MEKYELSPEQAKILAGMDKVYEKLIESKKRTNTTFIIKRDGKIVHVKPEDMETLEQIKERREREKLLK